MRRWDTFPRRNRQVGGDPAERRIEDLAKGLRDQVERRISLTGPLMNDYRWLARKLAEILTEPGADANASQPEPRYAQRGELTSVVTSTRRDEAAPDGAARHDRTGDDVGT
jgi:hypothetical protein